MRVLQGPGRTSAVHVYKGTWGRDVGVIVWWEDVPGTTLQVRPSRERKMVREPGRHAPKF